MLSTHANLGLEWVQAVNKKYTVDREMFTLKIIHVKIFHVVKFSQFHSIREIFLTVDECNLDERLESS